MVSEGEIWTLEKDLCRCCHAEGSFDNLATPQSFMDQEEIYSDMLRHCFDIDITLVPGALCAVTYTICPSCVLKLRDASAFKKQVQLCEEKFLELYYKKAITVKGQTAESEANVKDEPEIFYPTEYQVEFSPDEDDDMDSDGKFELHDPELDQSDDEICEEKLKKEVTLKKAVKLKKEIKLRKEIIKREPKTKARAKTQKREEKTQKGEEKAQNKEEKKSEGDAAIFRLRTVLDQNKPGMIIREVDGTFKKLDEDGNDKYLDYTEDYEIEENANGKIEIKVADRAENDNESDSKSKNSNKNKGRVKKDTRRSKEKGKPNAKKPSTNIKVKKFMEGGKEMYKCNGCDEKYVTRNRCYKHYMKTHVPNDGPRLVPCAYCDVKVPTKMRPFHMEIHGFPAPQCGACGRKFVAASKLELHIRRYHMGEKDFACDKCDLKFGDKMHLNRHYRTHSDEKPYTCKFCDKNFRWASNLRYHLMAHLKIKDQVCSLCGESFVQRNSLMYHMTSRHPQFNDFGSLKPRKWEKEELEKIKEAMGEYKNV